MNEKERLMLELFSRLAIPLLMSADDGYGDDKLETQYKYETPGEAVRRASATIEIILQVMDQAK